MIKNTVFSIVLLLLAAMQSSHAGGNSENSVTATVHYYKWHTGLLVSHKSMRNPDGCGRADFYMLEKSHPFYKELTALIMASHLTRQAILFNVDGCAEGFPAIQHVVSEAA